MLSDDELDELIISKIDLEKWKKKEKEIEQKMMKKDMIKKWNNIYFEYRRLGDNLQTFYKEIILPIKKENEENEIEFIKELEDEE